MATFPALEPTRRGYGITGELPMVIETAWPAGNVRFRTGFQPLTTVGMPLELSYADLIDSEAQQIRNHYAGQMAGTIPFSLPPIIFQGHATALTPAGIQWRYTDAPAETHKTNGRIDLTVTLEAMAFTAAGDIQPTP